MMYLLLANLYLGIFYGFYHVFLRKETFFQWNRIFLLGGLLLAFTMPLIENQALDTYAVAYQYYLPTIQVGEPVMVADTNDILKPIPNVTVRGLLTIGYSVGCLVSLLFFIFRLSRILHMLGKPKAGDAYSFFNFIRIDQLSEGHDRIRHHEQVHAREWHSLDIILMQLAKIFNWFNPVVYLYERAIKLQHEYIADRQTAAHDQLAYAQLLVSRAIGTPRLVLANPFSSEQLLKSRVSMLLRDKSPRKVLLRYSLLLPVVIAMAVLSVACNQGAKTTTNGDTMDGTEHVESASLFKEALAKNIVYRADALNNNRQGFLAVTYEKSGDELTNIQFLNEFGYGQEAEVMRVLKREGVASIAPAGKQMVLVNFKIQGITDEGNDFPPPVPISPDYGQLGEIVIVAYAEPPPPPPVEPRVEVIRLPKTEDNRKLEPPVTDENEKEILVVNIASVNHDQSSKTDPGEEQRDKLFQSVEISPEPPGGMRAFMEYVSRHYDCPKEAMEEGVNGQVQLSFVVEKDGSLTDIKIVKDLDYGTGEAAVRVLQSSSKWSPGIQNGRPVRVAYTLPIRLNLQS